MTAGSQRAALDAVHSARPIVARLSADRHKEDLAADIIDAWTAVETGLRSLIGGSTLAGQFLIRELRQRHFLSLEQANSLAEFNAARERVSRTDYTPTDADVNAVRDAFLKLESGLMGEPTAPIASTVPPTPAPTAVPIGDGDYLVAQPARFNPLALVLGIAGVIAAVALIWWLVARGGSAHSASYDEGVKAYTEGRREAAEGAFRKAATDKPTDAMPHVYLSRIERERGNMNNANVEAVRAVELESTNAVALRELASVRFAQGDYEGARKFYVRAISADASDRVSQGYLGCTLTRMGRMDEANKWLARAGTGPWSGCTPAPGAMPQPGTAPSANPAVPMTVPRP